jgi:PAS domain S-box-containing protein
LTFAPYSTLNLITNLFISGVPLSEVQREAEHGLAFARKARFGLVVPCFIGQLSLIRPLRVLMPTFISAEEEGRDEVRFEQQLAEKHLSFAACGYRIHKLQMLFFAKDYKACIEAAAKAQELLWTMKSFPEAAEYCFYDALARAAACDSMPAERRQEHFDALLAHHRQITVWAENCPENFANRAALVAAEIARLEGRELDAERSYEDAIRLAREGGFIQNEGIANELAARFYSSRGFETVSHAYLRNARHCYLRCGADGKVQQLDRSHPHLREELTLLDPTSLIGAPVEHLDLATVVRVSQTVSSEIVLEELIRTLMRIAVEHAGAERALFVLPQGDSQRIEAEATTNREAITVHLVGKTSTSSELPESVLKYAARSQESVILDDALAPNLFSADEYLAQKQVRSMLCLPLVKQGMVMGVLYLENTAASHAFTPSRIEVLKLLASQAAISLENARLYTDLQKSEDRMRLVIDTIPAIVCSSTSDGSVDSVNLRFAEYTGLPAESSFGDGWQGLIHPNDIAGVKEVQSTAIAEGRPYPCELRIRGSDGKYRYFLGRVTPLRNASGRVVKWYGSWIDIDDRKRADEAL